MKVRDLRKQMGISQEELAFRSGLHRTYIGMIERAEKNITLLNIEKIGNQLCTAFNPACVDCNLSKICDFYNEKNRWAN